MKCIFLLLFSIALFTQSYGQEKIYFERIEKEGGLQLGHIFDLFEDSEGFMWFCTNSGLIKYDGVQFKYLLHHKNDSTSLSSSWIHTGIQDSKGRLWIGTGNGLNRMDRKTQKFRRFFYAKKDSNSLTFNSIRSVFEDSNHRIWVGTRKGICVYNEAKDNFRRIHIPSFNGSRHNPKLFEDSKGNIWASSISGIYRIDPKTMSAVRFLPTGNELDDSAWSYDFYEEKDGKIWISTKAGIWIFNPADESFSQLKLPPDLINNIYNAFQSYANGLLLIGSFDTGLISWDLENNRLHKRYTRNPLDRNGPLNNTTYSLTKDRLGNLWVGTFNGAYKFNPQAQQFHIYENVIGAEDLRNFILNVNEDQYGGVWADSRAGLFYRKNINTPPIHFAIPPVKPNTFNGINRVFVDEQKKIWIGLRSLGLYQFDHLDSKSGRFINLGDDKKYIYCGVTGDKKNTNILWFNYEDGLLKYNKKTGKKKWFRPKDQLDEIPTNWIIQPMDKEDGFLWAKVRGGGIISFNKTTENFTYYKHDKADSSSILPGSVANIGFSSDGVWAATAKGLSFLKTGSESFINYMKNDTLFKYGVIAMAVDERDNIWLADNNGVSKFEPATQKFSSYYCLNKIQDFTYAVAGKSQSGQIYFGTPSGLLVFHPDSISIDTIAPKTILTNFTVNNKPYQLPKAAEFVDSIFLTPAARVFSFEYAGLHFKNARKIKFKVKLEGFDPDWRTVGTKRDATYTNLHPGSYTFWVSSANTDGVWSKKPLAVYVFISPPYWQTNWFYALMLLLLGSIIYFIYRARKHTRKLKEAKAIAEQSTRYKSRFLANMSHEIRTPMNAIVGMSKLILETPLDDKQKEYAGIVQQSAENLLVIINDILDQSKIESGQYSFVSKPFDLSLLIKQLERVFQYRIKEKGLVFTTDIPDFIPSQLIGDATRLNQILMNIINNAVKFTHKGSIVLSIRKEAEWPQKISLRFSIRDTGMGIDEENLSLIFDSFKQLKNSHLLKEKGSGLGLSIAKELVQGQGGEIWVESKKGEGSCFCFSLTFVKNKTNNISNTSEKIAKKPILKKMRFLIVEDTLFNQMLAVELLKKAYPNATLDLANNGQIALEKVRQNHYDLILMDIKMPVMDGLEASRLIRKMKDPRKNNIPILAVTANVVSEQLSSCKEAGMNDCITKPIDKDQLIEKINELLKITHA